ncbi:hypothetical protein AB1Y20_016769 [Prymnesium parvum]|uniref:Uncharacterized protein n=1 Tax=Prymnesium parvum TaxID=97485 RepID=A0AB34I9A1_PRYPA
MPLLLPDVRVAREQLPGVFFLLESAAPLSLAIDASTLSLLVGREPRPALHLALAGCLFGGSASRLLVVCKDRSAAHLIEFSRAEQMRRCASALLARHAELTLLPHPREGGALAAEEVEQLMRAPGFDACVRHVEQMIARRRALQLPDLLEQYCLGAEAAAEASCTREGGAGAA